MVRVVGDVRTRPTILDGNAWRALPRTLLAWAGVLTTIDVIATTTANAIPVVASCLKIANARVNVEPNCMMISIRSPDQSRPA